MQVVVAKNKSSFIYSGVLCSIAASSIFTRMFPKVTPVNSESELQAVCQILYRQYRKRGYCAENEQQTFSNPAMFNKESQVFVGRNRVGKIYGTISLFIDNKNGLPIDSICKEKIDLLRKSGAKVAEVGCLATELNSKCAKRYSLKCIRKMLPLFSLFRGMYKYSCKQEVTDLVIAVHPKHRELYTFLGFRQLSDVTSYAGACGAPALPMVLNLEQVRQKCPWAIKTFFIQSPDPVAVYT